MFTRKKLIILSFFISLLSLIGCATSHAPANYLPSADDIPQDVYGGWLTIVAEPDTLVQNSKWLMYGGEFIAVDDSVVYLLYDSLYLVPRRLVTESILELDEKNTTTYGLWVLGGSVLTISNGLYLGITLPLWLFVGIPTAAGESTRDRYEMDYPTQEYWESIKMFARFPQGINDIDLSKIKPNPITQN